MLNKISHYGGLSLLSILGAVVSLKVSHWTEPFSGFNILNNLEYIHAPLNVYDTHPVSRITPINRSTYWGSVDMTKLDNPHLTR